MNRRNRLEERRDTRRFFYALSAKLPSPRALKLNSNSAASRRASLRSCGAKRVPCSENRAVADNGGIVGRTWFLETLLPSGRKHRAPGYERTWIVFFDGRYVSERGSYPKIFGSRTALSLVR